MACLMMSPVGADREDRRPGSGRFWCVLAMRWAGVAGRSLLPTCLLGFGRKIHRPRRRLGCVIAARWGRAESLGYPHASLVGTDRKRARLIRSRTGPARFSRRAWRSLPAAAPRPGKPGSVAGRAVMAGNSGSTSRGCWRPSETGDNRTSVALAGPDLGPNRDRRCPLHFSQRLRALSAEWTPALYLAVPV